MTVSQWINQHISSGSKILALGSFPSINQLGSFDTTLVSTSQDEHRSISHIQTSHVNYWFNMADILPLMENDWKAIVIGGIHDPHNFSKDLILKHLSSLQLPNVPIIYYQTEEEAEEIPQVCERIVKRGYIQYDPSNSPFSVLLPSNIQLFTCIGTETDLAYLPHFLKYYEAQVDDIFCIVHTSDPTSPMFAQCKTLLIDKNIKFETFIGEFTTSLKFQRLERLINKYKNPYSWILHSDVDEQHEYPNGIRNFLTSCDSQGISIVNGAFVERSTEDGSLPAIRFDSDISSQYPKEFKLSFSLPKVCATRSFLHPTCGGWHQLIHGYTQEISTETIRVNHYRWVCTTRARYSTRRRQFKEKYENGDVTVSHWDNSRRLLDILIDGFIDFTSPHIV
jgi:hypothetical protein